MNATETMLLYALDCMAATAHDFDKRSVSKSERRRHRELCVKFADMLDGKASPPYRLKDKADVSNRLREVAQMLAKRDEPQPTT